MKANGADISEESQPELAVDELKQATQDLQRSDEVYLAPYGGSQSMNCFAVFISKPFQPRSSMLDKHAEARNRVFHKSLFAAELFSTNNHQEHTI
jgi:hypothetical protein